MPWPGSHGGVGSPVGLDDLRGLFQLQWFCDPPVLGPELRLSQSGSLRRLSCLSLRGGGAHPPPAPWQGPPPASSPLAETPTHLQRLGDGSCRPRTWTSAGSGTRMSMRNSQRSGSRRRGKRKMANQLSLSKGNFCGTGTTKWTWNPSWGKPLSLPKLPLSQRWEDQRNLGMSMRVERSTLDQVKKRFEVNKKKMEEKQKDYDFEERMKELREEEEKAKAYKKEKQREKKRRAEEDLTFEEDDEMAAVMGFSGFGSTKKSH